MMRAGVVIITLVLVACGGGVKVPQHAGQKGKPWNKPKVLKLEKNSAKAETDLDYARMKRAKWYAVDVPRYGKLNIDMEVTPGGEANVATEDESEEGEELDMDVAIEILHGESFAVLAKSDLESDDAHNLKKQLTLKDADEGRYLIHVYLQGRLDSADVELKLGFEPGLKPHASDFPNGVDWVPALAAVPPVDDTPEVIAKKKVRRIKTPTRTTVEKEPEDDDKGGAIMAEISDVQASGDNTTITIAGGTGDGLANGMRGSVKGMKRNGGFKLSGCGASTCRATIKAPVDDVRGNSNVIIQLK
jgi:hypothetical protein